MPAATSIEALSAFQGVKRRLELLEWAQGRGIPLGIVSNGDRDRQLVKLERFGLRRFFEDRLIRVRPRRDPGAKPHADGYIEVCQAAGCLPSASFAVGDQAKDVVGARLAGCRVVRLFERSADTGACAAGVLNIETPELTASTLIEVRSWLESQHTI